MALTDSPSTASPRRARRALAATAACTAFALPVALATPASAAPDVDGVAGTRAAALVLTLNLPQANQIQLAIDPVAGSVNAVGNTPEAAALADLVALSIAGNNQTFGRAEAKLPEPKDATGPAEDFNAGIADSPLAEFLELELLDAEAHVTEAPSSTSSATVASIALGLPAALVDRLRPALDPLQEGLHTLLTELAGGSEDGIAELCAGLSQAEPITQPVVDGLADVPGVGTIAEDLLGGVPEGEIPILCSLADTLRELDAQLQESLNTLTGPGGLLSTGILTAEQAITTEADRITATSFARVAGLTLLGQDAFAGVNALETRSTAVAIRGKEVSTATVDAAAVELVADPLANLRTDLDTLTGEIVDLPLDGVDEIVQELQAVFEGLLGIGIDAGRLGSPDDAIADCPPAAGTLAADLSGTRAEDDCAIAAARGYGLAITLPAELAEPLGIQGPLVELAITPTAAYAEIVSPAVQPRVEPQSLPRTGAETALAGLAVALLIGAGVLRRRIA